MVRNGAFTFLNPYSYLRLRENCQQLDRFDGIGIDGIALVWLLRLVGIKTERTSFDFTSIADSVFTDVLLADKTLYIVGSTPEFANKFADYIVLKYPSIKLIGHSAGYFENAADRDAVLGRISAIQPDVVIVGMGAHLQEQFVCDLMDAGWSGKAFTCGGFIEQTARSGRHDYYPRYMDKLNLRWLYRIWDQPALAKRYLFEYPKFLIFFVSDVIKTKRQMR